ncbi:MAG: DUF523 and DUF1722 domain-containing protein [Caldimicrobium sp.]|nr:DUF523 and DUF1722 domain-containing protein [Caldimicrobium sp.]
MSECFERAVRYDGGIIRDTLVEKLKAWVDPLYFCPEVSMGLGVPRPRITIVLQEKKRRLIQPDTKEDLTEKIEVTIGTFLDSVEEIDGALLKSKSPSCGVGSAKEFKEESYVSKGDGFFAKALKERFPLLPIEDEGRLRDRGIYYHFLTSIFTLAEFREVKRENNITKLIEFHTKYKFLLKTCHETTFKELGRLVAQGDLPVKEKLELYQQRLYLCLSRRPTRARHANTLYHLAGYFTKRMNFRERNHLINLIERYRHGRVDLRTILELLKALALRFEEFYVLEQKYLEPFPGELF